MTVNPVLVLHGGAGDISDARVEPKVYIRDFNQLLCSSTVVFVPPLQVCFVFSSGG
jgi:hypothetical protein